MEEGRRRSFHFNSEESISSQSNKTVEQIVLMAFYLSLGNFSSEMRKSGVLVGTRLWDLS